jgi:hypothetical protein
LLDIGDATVAVHLQFENVVCGIERFGSAGQAHWLDAGEHNLF